MEEWKKYKLGDLVTIKGGKRLPKGEQLTIVPNRHPYIRIRDLGISKTLDINPSFEYVPDQIQTTISRYIVNTGDVLLSIVGTIGLTGIVGKTLNNANLTENCVKFLNFNKLNPTYLYYFLKSDLGQNEIRKQIVGAVQPKLPIKNIQDIDILLPSIEVQQRIVSILSTIDDKIELNNRINHNLEEQAQALYKSWFVDFEPFKDGNFVESELGMIPEGWSIRKAEDFCEINIGKTPPRKEHQWFSNEGSDVTWISISDMGASGMYISRSSEMLTKEACKKFNIIVVPEGTVLLSFKLTVGRVSIASKDLTSNEAIARFLAPSDALRSYLYLALKLYDYSKLGSTSSIATAVNSKIIKGMPLICPPTDVLERFSEQVKGMFNSIKTLQEEISCLCEQRDSLLPRLMSGELTC